MFARISKSLMYATAACAAAGFGLVSGPAQAQPYNQPAYDQSAYDAPDVGGVTVIAPRRHREVTSDGAEIVWARATRVVDVSDLDLSSGWGFHEARARIERAAASACDQLDQQYVVGLYPVEPPTDADCYVRARDRALAQLGY